MRLLLTSSSEYFYRHIGDHVDKPLSGLRIAWITTAKKASNNPEHIAEHKERMRAMPFQVTDIDIESVSEEELRSSLTDCDVIYVHGGNTFYLLRAIQHSAFEKIVRERLTEGVLYVGTSAGAYVACPTIEMCTWKHDTAYEPFPDQDLTAMRLVPFLLTVHYDEKYGDDIRAGTQSTDLPVRILTDDQALLVEDENVILLGKGSEIAL